MPGDTRSIVVRLSASVGGYVAGMRQAAAATASFATTSTAAVESHGGSLDKMAKGAAIAGGVLAIGVGAAVKTFADFDKAMSGVRANVEATPAEFDALTKSIRTVGTNFGFSAKESAAGAEDLAKAGLSVSDIMGGALVGSLALAAAGQISTGEAAETAATAMTVFGLKGKDVPHIADLIAAGADRSTASVHSLAEGLQNGGSSAAQMGLTLQDTVGLLAEFDQAGLKGADGGTALKSMFQALAVQTPKAAKELDKYGISVFDATGKFVGMSSLAGQLQGKLGKLSDAERGHALAVIFGSHAVRAANILMKDGASGVTDWANKVNVSGFAAHNAGLRMDNLKGDIKKLSAAFQNDLIGAGAGAGSALRPVVQVATQLVGAFGLIPDSVKGAGLVLAAVGAAGLLASAGLLKSIAIVGSMRTQYAAARVVVSEFAAAQLAAGNAASVAAARETLGVAAMRGVAGAQGAVVLTAAAGAVQMGKFGSAIALIGTRVPLIASMQVAFVGAAAGAETYSVAAGTAAAATTALGTALLAVAGVAAVAAIAIGSVKLGEMQGKADTTSVSTNKLAASLKSLAGKDAAGGLADLFRYQGSSLSLFGHQIGGQRQEIVSTTSVIKDFATGAKQATQSSSSWNKVFDSFGTSAGVGQFKEQVKQLDTALASLVKSGNSKEAAAEFKTLLSGISDPAVRTKVAGMFTGYGAAVKAAGVAAKDAISPTKAMADSITGVSKTSKQAAADAKALADAIKGVGAAELGQSNSAIGYQQALADTAASLKKNGQNLDITTSKGRANQTALNGLAAATTQWASDTFTATNSVGQAQAILDSGRGKFVKLAESMGMPAAAAQKLAASLFKLDGVAPTVNVDGIKGATYAVDKLGNLVVSLGNKKITIPVDTPNAKQVASVLLAVKGAALAADSKSVTIPTSTPTATATIAKLAGISSSAITANRKSVNVKTSSLTAPRTKALVDLLSRATVSANGKSISIRAASPLAPSVVAKIKAISGAAVSADGKSVSIDTAALRTPATLAAIRSVLAAARNKSMTVTTRFVTVGSPALVRPKGGNVASAQATGGPAGIPGFAAGGVDMRRGGAVAGGGTGTSDSILARLAVGPVALSNREHVWTAAEVSAAGGHGAMYAMRRMARNGDIRELIGMPAHAAGGIAGMQSVGGGYAAGGVVDTSSYDPDMSWIMQLVGAVPSWQDQVDAKGKQKSARTAAAAIARSLSTARARYAQMMKGTGTGKHHKGPTHAQVVAGQNQINGLLAKQRAQQEAINKATAKYNQIARARTQSPGARFNTAVRGTNAVSAQFLTDIGKIKARGFGNLAFALLQQGDADARAVAHSLAGGKYADLKRAAAGVDTSDKLADKKAKLLDQLDPSRKAAREAEKKAAIADKKAADIERAKAVRDANAALLALRGANYAMSTASGVLQLPAVNLSPKSLDGIVKAIVSGGGRLNHATPVQVNSNLYMDGRAIANGVTTHQITDAAHGALLPGVTV